MEHVNYHPDRSCHPRYKNWDITKGPVEENRLITFWLDTQGRWKNCDLPTDFYLLLTTNPVVASWGWLLYDIVLAVFWALLFNEGIFTMHINETAFRYSFYVIAALSATVFFIASVRRRNMARAFTELCTATRAIMLNVQSNIMSGVVASDAKVKVITHDNQNYVRGDVAAGALPKRLAVVLNGLLCARRHAMHGDLCAKRLPLYPDQIAEVCATQAPAVHDSLYAMAAHLLRVMADAGATRDSFDASWLLKELHHAHTHIDQLQGFPRIILNGAWWTQFAIGALLPLFFSRLYPGYSVVWIAPLVLNFYHAALKYSLAQCDMMMTSRMNLWNDVEIARTLNNTANDNYATAVTIGRMVMDIEKSGAAVAAPPPPPQTSNARVGAAPEVKSLLSKK